MKNKIIQLIPTTLIIMIVVFSYFSQWCSGTGQICYGSLIDRMIPEITYPAYFFALYILPIAITLIFVSRTVFNSWFKLAVLVLPLLFIFVATTPVNWTGIGLNLFPFYRDDAARVAGGFFTVVSLLFIAWRYFSLRRSSQSKKARDASQT